MTDSDQLALSDLLEIAAQLQVPTLAVGANARQLIFDQPYALPIQRLTFDWDFGTRVKSWEQYRLLTERLVRSGKFKQGSAHSFVHVLTDVPVDVVPFGEIAAPDASIEWPETERQMSVLGFDVALEQAEEIDVAGWRLKVASLPWHIALKLIAFSDRRLEKDLLDISFILEHATDVQIDRLYDALASEFADDVIDYDEAGAYLIGLDLVAQAPAPVITALNNVLTTLLGDPNYLELRRHLTHYGNATRLALIVKRFNALSRGLAQRP